MMLQNKKAVLIVIGIPVGLVLVVLGFAYGKMKYENYVWYKKTDSFMNALQAPFRADVYGGRTPEETWGLYVDAVKKRDIDLASKYYDVDHRGTQLEFLQKEKQIDSLDLYLSQISNEFKKRNDVADFLALSKERAYYFYNFKSSKSNKIIEHDVNFYLNPLTKVWKILY